MGPKPTWICLMDVVHFVNIYQYNKVCMVILAKVEHIQGLLAIDLHVTFEPTLIHFMICYKMAIHCVCKL